MRVEWIRSALVIVAFAIPLAAQQAADKTISDEDLVIRPFPQVATGGKSLAEQWTDYRKAMIDYAGIAIFVFGNKRDAKGDVVPSNGMKQEYDLCLQAGVHPIPIGATGYMSEQLWRETAGEFDKLYPNASATFRQAFDKIGNLSTPPPEILKTIQRLIEELQRP